MAFTPLPGVSAAVKIGTVAYAFDEIKFNSKNTTPKVTNFTSAGYDQYVAGVSGGKATVSGPWDGGNMAAFVVGASITLVLDFSGTITASCPGIIESVDVDQKVDDVARATVGLQISGSFTAGLQ